MSATSTVLMIPPASDNVPSVLHLSGGVTLTPNSSGQFAVPTQYVQILMSSLAWELVLTGNPPTHAP
jgi:hypothetical protein